MSKYPLSIVIPVYKNYEMFYRYLKINIKYFDGCEVIIMNDYPGENISYTVKKIFPKAIVVNNKKNLGFAGNVNKGIKRARETYVFLMNSDVVLRDDSFLDSLKSFRGDRRIFAVGFAQLEKDGKIVGSNRAYFKNGLINHAYRPIDKNSKKPSLNFWAEGGAAIFRRKVFINLGMMDELFNPFYWEDIDLSYRAWKLNYKIYFDPSVLVEHHHESTIGKYFDKSKITKTAFRNQLFFHWKNLSDGDLLKKHLLNFPRYLFVPGFFSALAKAPNILKKRKKLLEKIKKSDREILELFK